MYVRASSACMLQSRPATAAGLAMRRQLLAAGVQQLQRMGGGSGCWQPPAASASPATPQRARLL